MEYSLEDILLYLDNALPKEQAESISEYLSKNPKYLQYAMELAKVKALDESQINRIKFEITKEDPVCFLSQKTNFTQFCSGLVEFLQEKKLAFRGEVKGCEYLFLGITLKFVYFQDDMFQLQLESKTPVYCEVIKAIDGTTLFQGEFIRSNLLSLDVGSLYYLVVHEDEELKILEIML